MFFKKRRFIYFVLFLLIIPVGLATRKQPAWFYPFIAEYGGDVLWSAMFFFLFRFLWPQHRLWLIALYTFLFSVAIELSQLYHAEWIDKIRITFLGRMLLGNTFLWTDIACYLAGTMLAWLIAGMADSYTVSPGTVAGTK
jgi:hypothetical protein